VAFVSRVARQESAMNLGEAEVTVVSEVFLEPEALLVTTLLRGEEVLKKHVAPVPPATVEDFEARGRDAILAYLQAAHLRYLQRLLAAPASARRVALRPGVHAAVTLGADGELLSSAGDEHVPPSWLRGAAMIRGLLDRAERDLGLGKALSARMGTDGLMAALGRSGSYDVVAFADPRALSELDEPSVMQLLEEVLCVSS